MKINNFKKILGFKKVEIKTFVGLDELSKEAQLIVQLERF